MAETTEPTLHIVLHQPEIPQNTGNIGRTCVALGAKLWLVRPLGFRLDETHLRRAGLDYWDHLDWECTDNWDSLTERLVGRRFWFFTRRATDYYADATYTSGNVLVFGNESQGLSTGFLAKHSFGNLRIPTSSLVRSLNLSNAVALVAYEAARQNGFFKLA